MEVGPPVSRYQGRLAAPNIPLCESIRLVRPGGQRISGAYCSASVTPRSSSGESPLLLNMVCQRISLGA